MNKLLLIAGCAVIAAAVGAVFQPIVAIQAYHFALLVCLQLALGSLFLLMLHQATGGRWGARVLPALLAGNRLVPWCLLGLIPVVAFLPAVYPWVGHPELVGDRRVFLNWPFFAIRCGFYFLFFGGLSFAVGRGLRPGSPGLVGFALVGYFVAIDIVMALDPRWYSTGFPVVFMTSSTMLGLSFAVWMTAATHIDNEDFTVWRDLGNLLLTLIIFWSYVAFTQFLIIWTGNLPEEIQWYVIRGTGVWKWVTIFLAASNVFVPFFILLARSVKDQPRRLQRVAAWLLICQVIYIYWLVAPSFHGRGASGLHWLDPVVLIALGIPFFMLVRNQTQKESRHG